MPSDLVPRDASAPLALATSWHAVVERGTTAAGIAAKQISPHRLRHTFAIRSLRSRHDVIAVQQLLGHASVATTQRYLDHLGLAELRQAVPDLPRAKTGAEEHDMRSAPAGHCWHVN